MPGIPGTWTTNLSDEDLRLFYSMYHDQPPTQEFRLGVLTRVITIRIISTAVPFKEGACRWVAVEDRHTVTYRTTYEWELWDAGRREVDELRAQQAEEKAVELQLFRTEDAHLLALASEAQAHEDYETAARFFCARAELSSKCRHIAGGVYSILELAITRFSTFPTSAHGIAYLRQYHPHAWIFHRFAQSFAFWNKMPADQKHVEIDRIHDEATRALQVDGRFLKSVCLFWRREGRLDLAIKYCQMGIDRKLSDDTKSSFAGRLQRFILELQQGKSPTQAG